MEKKVTGPWNKGHKRLISKQDLEIMTNILSMIHDDHFKNEISSVNKVLLIWLGDPSFYP